MFGLENASGIEGAVAVIGVVLVEAILLYVGYGALERLVGPALIDALGGDE
jgi:hypothetical protein